MPKSINKVILLGHLGRDVEVKYTSNGTAMASFSMATSSSFKDRDGQWQERTEWHNIKAWAKLAEVAEKYLHKGSQVYIEGHLQTSSWDDKDSGTKKYKTDVVVEEIVLLGSKGEPSEPDRPPERAPEQQALAADPDNPFA